MLKILVCNPVRAAWDRVDGARCLSQRVIFMPDRVVAIITNLVILLVPAVLVWRIKVLSAREKLRTTLLLGAGGIATLVTIFRLYWGVRFLSSNDFTFDYAIINITA